MPRQIGWSQESNLLYNISMQLDRLAAVTAAAGGGGGGTITGGGTSGQVTFWNGATSITGSNNLFWDSTNSRLGIGTNTPSVSLSVPGQSLFGTTTNGFSFSSNTLTTYGNSFITIPANRALTITDSTATLNLLRIVRDTGNILINTGTDAGFRLDVNGTSRFQNDVQISTGAAAYSLSITNTVGSTPLYLNAQGSGTAAFEMANLGLRRLRILVTSTNTTFEQSNQTGGFIFGANSTFNGNVTLAGNISSTSFGGVIQAGSQFSFYSSTGSIEGVLGITLNSSALSANGIGISRTTNITTNAANFLVINSSSIAFAPTSGSNEMNGILVAPIVNQTGTATGITRGVYVNPTLTSAVNWRSVETSNNGGWAIYAGGTAPSLFNGDVSISGKLALTVVANRQTVNYSLVLADNGKLVEMNVGAANTLTVPPNSSIAFPIGTKIDIAQYGAGQTSIVPGVGVTVRSALGALKLAAQYSGASLVKIGTDEWYLFGDITV